MKIYETPFLEILLITEDIVTTSLSVMTPFLPVEEEGEWEII